LPAAVLVSIGCSIAFKAAPLALSVRTMSCRSAIERAKRSTLVGGAHPGVADRRHVRAPLLHLARDCFVIV
jgi:hypothetical protein